MSNVSDEEIRVRLARWQHLAKQFFVHYKTKNLYYVDAVSLLEEDMETVLVTYHPVNKTDMSFVRTVNNFTEMVTSEDDHEAGLKVERFSRYSMP